MPDLYGLQTLNGIKIAKKNDNYESFFQFNLIVRKKIWEPFVSYKLVKTLKPL